ncbi:lysophospholipid acyltransferase 7-like [Daphnia pulicaria]|uniref:lysophospholipid acyltransferase 7-like n=1 Tax=Daphnia pulicaria TaxID=35523 RepID=UPI001EEC1C85|nr:lysophospholipid acyltransferase 7-like [Daphnia pulicaria]
MEGSTLPWESLDPDHYFGLNRLSCHLVGCCFCRLHLAIFHFRLLSVENMLWDDVIYLFLLLATIGLGEVLRRFDNANIKQSISTAIGFAIVFIVSGFHTLHCVLTAAVNALIIRYVSPKFCHGLSFGFSFTYILFFRFTTVFGLPEVPSHTNAIQMLLTLRMVGLALEVHETAKNRRLLKESNSADKKQDSITDVKQVELVLEYQGVNPSFLDVFHYAFCYIGVLTGPYYKYRTYWDMLHANDTQISFFNHARHRLRYVPVYVFFFILSSYYFPLSYATTEEFFAEHSTFYRIWYMTPLFFNFRMRFYSGFILSEVACIMAGLGAYPEESQPKPGNGPTALQSLSKKDRSLTTYNFETVHNIDEYSAETCDVRGSMRAWNMTVQWWLVVNVHRRFPVKPLRTVVTMLISAFWHGVHSGYYLSMLTVPFILVAEDAIKKKLRPIVSPKIFNFGMGFMKIQWFSYMGVAFSLLAMDVTLAYWKSIYFIGHLLVPVFYLACLTIPTAKPVKSTE